jgi:adenylate cyclase class IV
MLEVELKSVVDDVAARRALVERAGGTLTFEGRLEDRRYDTAERALGRRDHVLRLRTYRGAGEVRAELDWKGPTRLEGGYKLREELGTPLGSPDALALILGRLGYVVTTSIDREIAQYDLAGTIVRFERYPRLDVLVEVEGTPEGIERAIAALGMPRRGFTTDRLGEFVARFESRTGQRAAICDADLDDAARDG